MQNNVLKQLFKRDLEKLRNEVRQYSSEEDLWITEKGISNSAGNLSYHITGNLQYYVGTVLGGTDYQRDRKFEFSGKVSRAELLSEIDEAEEIVIQTLKKLTTDDLEKLYPLKVFEDEMTTGYFLTHLYGHLNYHLGQINYHRRLLS
jgi:uncharacterized damage-inducible protein DinB